MDVAYKSDTQTKTPLDSTDVVLAKAERDEKEPKDSRIQEVVRDTLQILADMIDCDFETEQHELFSTRFVF